VNMKSATIAVEGFGNAGQFASQLVEAQGAKAIAASDSKGGVYNKAGISIAALRQHKEKTGSVVGFPGAKSISNEELLELDCTILIPAALENQINSKNAKNIKAKIVAEAANGPTTPDADEVLYKNKTLVIPDILANGGGVTVSYFEWLQNLRREYWTEDEVNQKLDKNITKAFLDIYKTHEDYDVNMRKASMVLAVNKVVEATNIRGLWP
jgi:glutamate dehydrogenase (NAD(P)+)